jgi:hypothetical protein
VRRNNFRHGNFFTAVQKRKSSAAFLARGGFPAFGTGQVGPEFCHSCRINFEEFNSRYGNVCVILGICDFCVLVENVLGSASDPTVADCGVIWKMLQD